MRSLSIKNLLTKFPIYLSGFTLVIFGYVLQSMQASKSTHPNLSRPHVFGERKIHDYQTNFKGDRFSIHGATIDVGALKNQLLKAQEISDPSAQNTAIRDCLEGVSAANASSILSLMTADEYIGPVADLLFDIWSSSYPEEAITWALNIENRDRKNSFMEVAVLRWSAQDLNAAIRWVRSMSGEIASSTLKAAVIQQAAISDPILALQMIDDLPIGAIRSDLIVRAVGEWAINDSQSAIKYASDLTDGSLRDSIIERIAIIWSAKDVNYAADIALNHISDSVIQDRVLISILQTWVQSDPAHAALWVSQFPEDQLGFDAADLLVRSWASTDSVAAGNWLATLPISKLRNAAILAYSHQIRLSDSKAADDWLAQITTLP